MNRAPPQRSARPYAVRMMKRVLAVLVGAALAVGVGASPALAAAPYFYYAGGTITSATAQTGVYLAADVYKPTLNTAKGDSHSLWEMLVKDPMTGTTIELGWTVDPALNGDANPHLFAGVWTNGTFQGYNTGITAVNTTGSPCNGTTGTYVPGATIPGTYPNLLSFGIEHTGTWPTGAWWLKAGPTGWAGCVLDSYLSGKGVSSFGTFTLTQAFGELASASHSLAAGTAPCGQMGSGVKGSAAAGPPAAARVANVQWAGGVFPSWTQFTQASDGSASSTYYDTAALGTSGRSFYYGGVGKLGVNPPC
jgi:hypothetical protein